MELVASIFRQQAFDVFESGIRFRLCKREQGLFPNIQVNVGPSGVTLVRVYPDPDDVGRSVSRVSFYFDPATLAEEPHRVAERLQIFGNIIRDEDYAVAATAQLGADSGVQDYVLFGRNEPALHHYHNTYRAALGMEPLELIKD